MAPVTPNYGKADDNRDSERILLHGLLQGMVDTYATSYPNRGLHLSVGLAGFLAASLQPHIAELLTSCGNPECDGCRGDGEGYAPCLGDDEPGDTVTRNDPKTRAPLPIDTTEYDKMIADFGKITATPEHALQVYDQDGNPATLPQADSNE